MNNPVEKSLCCLSSITLDDPEVSGSQVKSSIVIVKNDGEEKEFTLRLKYPYTFSKNYLPLLRLAAVMPLLNYGLFTKEIVLRFPLTKQDISLLEILNRVFSRDIFVNKILRRRAEYILPEYLPDTENIRPSDSEPRAVIKTEKIVDDILISDQFDTMRCGVLSSGGKESLLTYGMLQEVGCRVYPIYVNESGGHWRTALPAFRYHQKIDPNTMRVWTNVDRFYVFMLDTLRLIRPDHRQVRADTYPIRLCIFPYYLFLLLPLFVSHRIGNLLIGSEFDDFPSPPIYQGIEHYFGVYDQHQDYDELMNHWYTRRLPGLYQWSAVRNISGLIVERILTKRYRTLAEHQRSCHSCYIKNDEIRPCGICSKCQGVLLFLFADHQDPQIMKFNKSQINTFSKHLDIQKLRLDADEKNHSLFLARQKINDSTLGEEIPHIEQIHHHENSCDLSNIPLDFRLKLLDIIKDYTKGYCTLQQNQWVSTPNPLKN